jgi:transcriptional regulator GlxA family with amidase domain
MALLTPPPGRTVAILAAEVTSPFELSVACEVFGVDRTPQGIPAWDVVVCSGSGGPIRTNVGFALQTPYGLERVRTADIVVVPGWPARSTPPPEPMLDALRVAAARGAWILSFCTGAFVLGHAGLLDGQRATTHWMWADEFRTTFPAVRLDPGVLYVADEPVMTSAGTAAAIDLSLHVVRLVDGPEVANAIARRMIVPPHRDGGQSQFVELPMPAEDADVLTDLLDWMSGHLAWELSVDELAARVHMSPRTFARRFRAETGTTPHNWLTGQRVLHAQRLLETTTLGVDRIAAECGLGSAATLRHHFASRVGISPQRYRDQFRCRPAAVPA